MAAQAVAPGQRQLMLDGMPGPTPRNEERVYPEKQLSQAREAWARLDRIEAENPHFIAQVVALTTDCILKRGRIGTRQLSEAAKDILRDAHKDAFDNAVQPCLARRVIEHSPWLREYIELRPCAADVVRGDRR